MLCIFVYDDNVDVEVEDVVVVVIHVVSADVLAANGEKQE